MTFFEWFTTNGKQNTNDGLTKQNVLVQSKNYFDSNFVCAFTSATKL
jgi:hypothetical protein